MPEKDGGTWRKEGKILLRQLKEAGKVDVARDVVSKVGYDDTKVRKELHKLAEDAPEQYSHYAAFLRARIGENEKEVQTAFDGFLATHPETDQSKERRKELEKRVVTETEMPKDVSEKIKEMFPSGNYLDHGTSIKSAMAIAGDPDGALKSAEEIRKKNPNFTGHGGVWGISFSFNGVGAMPGSWRHMAIFVTSPEVAMKGGRELNVTYRANEKELQLLGGTYDLEIGAYVESTYDFFKKRNSLDDDGVEDDFAELKTPLVYEKGETPIERDLKKLSDGDLTEEDISANYKVIEGRFVVSPSVNEQDISLGLIYADYLLKHTPEGRALQKDLKGVSPAELLKLYYDTSGIKDAIFEDMERASKVLKESMALSLPIEDTIIFVQESDLKKWLDVFSRVDKAPKAFVSVSRKKQLVAPNWNFPEGQWEKAEEIIEGVLTRAGAPAPSISYDQILGRETRPDDLIQRHFETSYIKWEVVAGSKKLTQENGALQVKEQALMGVVH